MHPASTEISVLQQSLVISAKDSNDGTHYQYQQMRRLKKIQRKSSKPSQTPLKSRPHTGITLTRFTVTSNKERMSQLTNLIRESRILLKDASIQMKRNWYVELNFFFMPLNSSKSRSGCDQSSNERT